MSMPATDPLVEELQRNAVSAGSPEGDAAVTGSLRANATLKPPPPSIPLGAGNPLVQQLQQQGRATSGLRAVPGDLLPHIHEAAQRYNLDPHLISEVMRAESGFNPKAVSKVGAQGLMQLMPPTAKHYGARDVFDPRSNIMAGAAMLRDLSNRYGGNIPKILAAYNAGPGAVDRYGGVPPYKETQNYVKSIGGRLKGVSVGRGPGVGQGTPVWATTTRTGELGTLTRGLSVNTERPPVPGLDTVVQGVGEAMQPGVEAAMGFVPELLGAQAGAAANEASARAVQMRMDAGAPLRLPHPEEPGYRVAQKALGEAAVAVNRFLPTDRTFTPQDIEAVRASRPFQAAVRLLSPDAKVLAGTLLARRMLAGGATSDPNAGTGIEAGAVLGKAGGILINGVGYLASRLGLKTATGLFGEAAVKEASDRGLIGSVKAGKAARDTVIRAIHEAPNTAAQFAGLGAAQQVVAGHPERAGQGALRGAVVGAAGGAVASALAPDVAGLAGALAPEGQPLSAGAAGFAPKTVQGELQAAARSAHTLGAVGAIDAPGGVGAKAQGYLGGALFGGSMHLPSLMGARVHVEGMPEPGTVTELRGADHAVVEFADGKRAVVLARLIRVAVGPEFEGDPATKGYRRTVRSGGGTVVEPARPSGIVPYEAPGAPSAPAEPGVQSAEPPTGHFATLGDILQAEPPEAAPTKTAEPPAESLLKPGVFAKVRHHDGLWILRETKGDHGVFDPAAKGSTKAQIEAPLEHATYAGRPAETKGETDATIGTGPANAGPGGDGGRGVGAGSAGPETAAGGAVGPVRPAGPKPTVTATAKGGVKIGGKKPVSAADMADIVAFHDAIREFKSTGRREPFDAALAMMGGETRGREVEQHIRRLSDLGVLGEAIKAHKSWADARGMAATEQDFARVKAQHNRETEAASLSGKPFVANQLSLGGLQRGVDPKTQANYAYYEMPELTQAEREHVYATVRTPTRDGKMYLVPGMGGRVTLREAVEGAGIVPYEVGRPYLNEITPGQRAKMQEGRTAKKRGEGGTSNADEIARARKARGQTAAPEPNPVHAAVLQAVRELGKDATPSTVVTRASAGQSPTAARDALAVLLRTRRLVRDGEIVRSQTPLFHQQGMDLGGGEETLHEAILNNITRLGRQATQKGIAERLTAQGHDLGQVAKALSELERGKQVFREGAGRNAVYRRGAAPARAGGGSLGMAGEDTGQGVLFHKGGGTAPTFFSALQRGIDAMPGKQATAEQVSAALAKGGVKPDELKWTGFDDFLAEKKAQGEPVTKAEAQEFLRQNAVEVREVVKGGDVDASKREAARAYEARTGSKAYAPNGSYSGGFTRSPEWEKSGISPVKFGQYTTPGGENYRELLLTLPEALPLSDRKLLAEYKQGYGELPERLRPYAFDAPQKTPIPEPYRSSHWDEPNVLAHVRFDERTDAEGRRVLHVAEIQSDWHQAGRKRGYEEPALTGVLSDEEYARRLRTAGQGVPNAPFSKTWHELALKRTVRWAAEHGFDAVTWDPGEVQADRYDLSKQVSKLAYHDASQSLQVYGLDGRLIDSSKMPPEKVADHVGKDVAEKLLAAPESAIDPSGAKFHVLEGLDLKVGGEGMKGFYDKILPAAANKLGKKFGAKVGETVINAGAGRIQETPGGLFVIRRADGTGSARSYTTSAEAIQALAKMEGANLPGHTVPMLPITPEMRHSVVEEGQPLFRPEEKTPEGWGGEDASGVTHNLPAGDWRHAHAVELDAPEGAKTPTRTSLLDPQKRHTTADLEFIRKNEALRRVVPVQQKILRSFLAKSGFTAKERASITDLGFGMGMAGEGNPVFGVFTPDGDQAAIHVDTMQPYWTNPDFTPEQWAKHLVETKIHELAHLRVREEGPRHLAEMDRIRAAIGPASIESAKKALVGAVTEGGNRDVFSAGFREGAARFQPGKRAGKPADAVATVQPGRGAGETVGAGQKGVPGLPRPPGGGAPGAEALKPLLHASTPEEALAGLAAEKGQRSLRGIAEQEGLKTAEELDAHLAGRSRAFAGLDPARRLEALRSALKQEPTPSASTAPPAAPKPSRAPVSLPETPTPLGQAGEVETGKVETGTGLANQVQVRPDSLLDRLPEKGEVVGKPEGFNVGRTHLDNATDPIEMTLATAKKVADEGRPPTWEEVGVMTAGEGRLKATVRDSGKALDAALSDPARAGDVRSLQETYEAAKAKRQGFLDDVQKGKTAWHNTGVAFQAGVNLDTGDYEEVLREAKRAKGKDLSPAESEQLKRLSGKIGEETPPTDPGERALWETDTLNGRIDKLRRERDAALSREQANEQAAKAAVGGGKAAPETTTSTRTRTPKTHEQYEAERAAIRANIQKTLAGLSGKVSAGPGPALFDLASMGVDAGKLLLSIADEHLGGKLSDYEAVLRAGVEELKRLGVTATRDDMRDAIVAATTRTPGEAPSRSEAVKRRADLIRASKEETALLEKLASLERGEKTVPPEKRPALTARIQELRDQIAAKQKELAPRKTQAEKDATKAKARVKRQAESGNKLFNDILTLAEGGRLPDGTKPTTPEETARLHAWKRHLQREQELQDEINDLSGQLRTGPRTPPPPKARDLTRNLEDLEAQRNMLGNHVRRLIDAKKPKGLLGRAADVNNALRSLKTIHPLAALGRQGLILGVGNPDIAARSFADQMKALSSPTEAARVHREIVTRPNAYRYRQAKLFLSNGTSLTPGEELVPHNLFPGWTKFNPATASSRAYVAYLDRLRADSFDRFTKSLGPNSKPEDLKTIARTINAATGRGSLGENFDKAVPALAHLLFAPRFLASRIEYPLRAVSGGGLNASMAARKAVWRMTFQSMIGMTTLYGLAQAAGAKVSKDPTSSDFGKLRYGDQRVDVLGGLQQAVVLGARLTTGKDTTVAGKTKDLDSAKFGQTGSVDVAQAYARSKLAPVPGIIWNTLAHQNRGGGGWRGFNAGNVGTDMIGQPISAGRMIADAMTPLGWQEAIDGARDAGLNADEARNLLGFLGFHVQTVKSKVRRTGEGL